MTSPYLLASNSDNVAIVPRRLEAGEEIDIAGTSVGLRWPILQGHRISVEHIAKGAPLLSWGLPFGTAARDISPGEYLCNAKAREVLLVRNPNDYDDRLEVNFEDRDTTAERSLPQSPEFGKNVSDLEDGLSFEGYYRGPTRGWGTRNYVAVIGVTSQARHAVLTATAQLAERFPATDGFDGVVPIVHTEGGGRAPSKNRELLLRTLAGFGTNPNVGAAILVNVHGAGISEADLEEVIAARGLSAAEYNIMIHTVRVPHDVDVLIDRAAETVPRIAPMARAVAPASELRLALQCGGSDAFSGVTANQVLGRMAHDIIRRGGIVNLAETDELIGAEEYILQRTADRRTYDSFLTLQQRFKDYAAAHGHTAEGNVSGGNLYRGLYNITLKSIGAARKKDPRTFVDHTIDYAEPMRLPGYYFMDSPGNDLESIAGQVASGANVILFTTGNGSITNFPFVPTIKIVTTDERFSLLESDMDFNAGLVLSGETFDDAASRLLDLLRKTASGERSKGEHTSQYQTQIWREAYFPGEAELAQDFDFGHSPHIPAAGNNSMLHRDCAMSPQAALILPTSLCSGQVAEQIASRINAEGALPDDMRAIALPHTEGCGVSGGQSESIFRDTLIGYATHPLVARCVFLEHGCEKTHNDYFKNFLNGSGLSPESFEWASIQLEGGIEAVSQHVIAALAAPYKDVPRPMEPVFVGLATGREQVDAALSAEFANLARALLEDGGGVIVAANDPLLKADAFLTTLGLSSAKATIGYADCPDQAGLQIMDCSTTDWIEIATGLGASGCRALIVGGATGVFQPHRFIPTLQVGDGPRIADFDITLGKSPPTSPSPLYSLLRKTLRGDYIPVQRPTSNVGFQISRGRFGVSL